MGGKSKACESRIHSANVTQSCLHEISMPESSLGAVADVEHVDLLLLLQYAIDDAIDVRLATTQ